MPVQVLSQRGHAPGPQSLGTTARRIISDGKSGEISQKSGRKKKEEEKRIKEKEKRNRNLVHTKPFQHVSSSVSR